MEFHAGTFSNGIAVIHRLLLRQSMLKLFCEFMSNRLCVQFLIFSDHLSAADVFVLKEKRNKREKPVIRTKGNRDNSFCLLY